jgi:hypothetical protein
MAWDGGGVELGTKARGFAEVGEIGGETVAEVDGCGCEATAQKCGTDGEARLGEEVGV